MKRLMRLMFLLGAFSAGATAQSTDSSSYFPLGLWGIWIDRARAPYAGSLQPDDWDKERANWQAINGNYLVYWIPYWEENNLMTWASTHGYKMDIANWHYWDSAHSENPNSLYRWMNSSPLSDSVAAINEISRIHTAYGGQPGFHNYTFGQEGPVTDQTKWSKIEFLSRRIHDIDPSHKSYMVAANSPPAGFTDSVPHLDILQVDPYVFRVYIDPDLTDQQSALDDLLDHYDSTMRSVRGKHTEWQAIIQAHSEISGDSRRRPSALELRVQAYLALSRGARGITSYVYGSEVPVGTPKESDPLPIEGLLLGGAPRLVYEIRGLIDLNRDPYTSITDPDGIPAFQNVAELYTELSALGPQARKLRLYDAFPNSGIPTANASCIIGVSGNFVEIGVFKRFDQGPDSTAYFMLVNRICNDATGEIADSQAVTVSFAHPAFQWLKITEVVSGRQWAIAGSGAGAVFSDKIAPGGGKLYKLEQADLMTLAAFNKSASSTAIAYSNQRKLCRESNGRLHEVFESGGEAFYRNSTNDGATWQVTTRLSGGSGGSAAPCITMAGTTVIVVWQRWNGSSYQIQTSRSTNGGSAWSAPAILATVTSASPGPIPSVSGCDNAAFLAYRTASGSMNAMKSTNAGSSWASIAVVPGSTSTCNSPSSMMYYTPWMAAQSNLAYATNTPANSPRIYYTYFDFDVNNWGGSTDITSVVPSQYTAHGNPCLAVAPNTRGTGTVHVVWDALAPAPPPNMKVAVHRKMNFRSPGSTYSVLIGWGETSPSVSSVQDDRLWMISPSNQSSYLQKRYYNGSSWQTPTAVALGGMTPQMSVGRGTGTVSAKYIYAVGAQAPYTITVGAEALGKTGDGSIYSRELNIIDPSTGEGVTFELQSPSIGLADGSVVPIDFNWEFADTTTFDLAALVAAGRTAPFSVPQNAVSLIMPVSVYGSSQAAVLDSTEGTIALQVFSEGSSAPIGTVFSKTSSSIEAERVDMQMLSVPVKSSLPARGSLRLVPSFTGVRKDKKLIFSLGHIYRASGPDSMTKKMVPDLTGGVPDEVFLAEAYPNPFNPATVIRYGLPAPSQVSLVVFDALGREVTTLVNGEMAQGLHEVRFSQHQGGKGLASGLYFARLTVADTQGRETARKTIKLILMK